MGQNVGLLWITIPLADDDGDFHRESETGSKMRCKNMPGVPNGQSRQDIIHK